MSEVYARIFVDYSRFRVDYARFSGFYDRFFVDYERISVAYERSHKKWGHSATVVVLNKSAFCIFMVGLAMSEFLSSTMHGLHVSLRQSPYLYKIPHQKNHFANSEVANHFLNVYRLLLLKDECSFPRIAQTLVRVHADGHAHLRLQ